MKITKRLAVLCGAAAALIVCVVLILEVSLKKPVVAFYGLNERQKNALMELKVFYDKNGKANFKFVELDSEKPLKIQFDDLAKVDLLFAFESAALEQCVRPMLNSTNKKIGIDQKFLGTFTDAASGAAGISSAGQAVKVPLLNDFFSFAGDSNFMNEFEIAEFNSLGDVERYLRRCKNYVRSPFVFAGAEKNFTLDLVGAFCESVSGVEQYKKAVKMCSDYYKEGNRDARELLNLLCFDGEEPPLSETMNTLSSWYKNGYFSKDVFSMKYNDVFEFMKDETAPLVLLPLSVRREAKKDFVKRYSSFFIPTDRYGSRAFYAPMLCMVCTSTNKKAADAAQRLSLGEMQESFSSLSGLAPVMASCKVADRQADDARYWVAASIAPLAGLCEEGFIDTDFADEVSDLLKQIIVN